MLPALPVGFAAWMIAPVLSAQLFTPAAPWPLAGEGVIVWLNGPLGQSLPVRLLSNCYLAAPERRPVAVVCLD